MSYKNINKDIKSNFVGLDTDLATAESNITTLNSAFATLTANPDLNLENIKKIGDAIVNLNSEINAILVDNLTTSDSTKALTANQGVVIKGLIDGLTTSVTSIKTRNAFTAITANVTLTSDQCKGFANISAAVTAKIAPLQSSDIGKEFMYINVDTSTAILTIDGNGKNIDAATTLDLNPGETARFFYDGTILRSFS